MGSSTSSVSTSFAIRLVFAYGFHICHKKRQSSAYFMANEERLGQDAEAHNDGHNTKRQNLTTSSSVSPTRTSISSTSSSWDDCVYPPLSLKESSRADDSRSFSAAATLSHPPPSHTSSKGSTVSTPGNPDNTPAPKQKQGNPRYEIKMHCRNKNELDRNLMMFQLTVLFAQMVGIDVVKVTGLFGHAD